MEFEKLIDNAIMILGKEMNKKEYSIFSDRYMRIDNSLRQLKTAYKIGNMNKKSICLNVVKMINHGDSEELQSAITEVNHYYQDYIYME